MIEYTSLDVSRRLAEAGFVEIPDAGVYNCNGDTFVQIAFANDWSHMARAYRADTLMEWLAERGMITYLAKSADGFHVAYALTGVGLWTANVDAKTIPDALGEVVLAVLAKEAKHGK